MSNLAHGGDDFPDAAGKNLSDAMTLLEANRYDGAGYLAGYVVECSLKTFIVLANIAQRAGFNSTGLVQGFAAGGGVVVGAIPNAHQTARAASRTPQGKKPSGSHDLENLSREAIALASLPSSATAKYAPPNPMANLHPSAIYANGWTESLRYQSPGTLGPTMATAWVEEAKKVYRATVAEMRRDGVVF